MKHLYKKIKAPFLELEKELDKEERILLRNARYFFAFCILAIVSVLIYYSRTGEEFLPLLILGIITAVFWTHSDKTGKIFMITAASIGFIHEVIGGMEGWFVYSSGAVFQTPLWLIPGYAVMYWACYNLWKQGKKKYRVKERNFKILVVSLIILTFVLDATIGSFRPDWPFDFVFIGIILLLFKVRAERHLALVTWAMVAFNEFLGFSLGAWQHYSYAGQVSTLAGPVNIHATGVATGFSFTGITASYLLFLWISLRFVAYVKEKKLPSLREFALLTAALALKAYTWFTTSTILAMLLAGKLL